MRKIRSISTTFMTLAVLAASLGGAAAQSEAGPAAEAQLADPMAPAWVTGTIPWVGTPMGRTETTVDDGVERVRDDGWTGMRAEMSDPRISGELTSLWNTDTYEVPDGHPVEVQSGMYRIENEGGSWQATASGLFRLMDDAEPADNDDDAVVLVGEGGYEGLIAFLVLDWTDYGPGSPITVVGAIVPGDLPPMPSLE